MIAPRVYGPLSVSDPVACHYIRPAQGTCIERSHQPREYWCKGCLLLALALAENANAPANEDRGATAGDSQSQPRQPTKARRLTMGHTHCQPVGSLEIAELCQVAEQTARAWRHRGHLPEPTWTIGARPLWCRDVIVEWARETGRLPKEA